MNVMRSTSARRFRQWWLRVALLAVATAVTGPAWAQQAATKPDLSQAAIDPASPVPWTPVPAAQATLPAVDAAPQQVNVSVKVIEYQTSKGVDTGLSAYFQRKNKERAYGRVTSGEGAITTADLTFPISTQSGISVFLDRLHISDGDLEVTMQALVNENRASILAQPREMVMLGSPIPTIIKTVDQVPYEETVVVGVNVVQTTKFRDTGVKMKIQVPQAIDDDGNWATTNDTYIMLNVEAEVNQAGQRYTVALNNQGSSSTSQLQVPEFVTRQVNTSVWVRHGQVLILGGMYRKNTTSNTTTMPWLPTAEDLAVGLAERLVPGDFIGSPVSSTLGNRSVSETRRELVFILKAEIWRPSFTVAPEHGFTEPGKEEKPKSSPTDVISGVIQGISNIPQGIAEGIARPSDKKGIDSELGGSKK